nr:putative ribonuclease H-like domain-containing protein [Tanacetum cinerariifolium]
MYDKKNTVLFTNTECIVLSPEFKLPNENQVLLRVPRENNMYNIDLKNIVPSGDLTCLFAKNTDDDATFGGKKPEFKGEKPESEVYVSPSSSAQTKKLDDKTKRDAKGKSPIELSTGYRNLSAEFEDSSDNSINEEEGTNYEEVFALVVRIEAIRLFLDYASFMGFMVYLMDVKSAFLYGTIEEEIYVCQPLGFEDPDYPDKVYKVVKALYGLHQAP